MPKCDEQLLLDYANHFLGYGALNSPLWLIGPEAGGGNAMDGVCKRALVWADRGRKENEDLQCYHKALGLDWTGKIQPTWGPLIRVILALNGKRADTAKDVREFQRDALGRSDGQNAILDLSQLSSPSRLAWIFNECGITWLRTRGEYEAYMLPPRCDLFQKRLAIYRPRLVLFYGLGHQCWWERIAGRQFEPSGLRQLCWVQGENSLFALIPHPNAIRRPGKGANNEFFAEVGAALREKLGS